MNIERAALEAAATAEEEQCLQADLDAWRNLLLKSNSTATADDRTSADGFTRFGTRAMQFLGGEGLPGALVATLHGWRHSLPSLDARHVASAMSHMVTKFAALQSSLSRFNLDESTSLLLHHAAEASGVARHLILERGANCFGQIVTYEGDLLRSQLLSDL